MAQLLVSDLVNQVYQQMNLIGQQIDQSDVFMYATNAINYFSTSYVFPTALKSVGSLVFNGVREYGVASDFGTLGEPQRFPALWSPHFQNTSGRELTHWPYGRKISVQYDNSDGSPYLLIADACDGMQSLWSSCDSTTGVTVGGDASGLTLDNMIYTEGTGSLRFTITPVTGQSTITFTGLGVTDITDYLTKNWNFLDLIAPTTNTANFTNIKLRIGTDASNYYEMTATTRYRGTGIGAGYGQVGFDFTAATQTGTVTLTNVTYMQVILNHGTSGVSGVYHLDNIFTAQGVYFLVPYYSRYNILSGGVTPAETITALTDVILLPVQCNEAILYKTLELIASSPNVKDQSFANYAARELQNKEFLLRSLYPSERILVQSTYYKKGMRSQGSIASSSNN